MRLYSRESKDKSYSLSDGRDKRHMQSGGNAGQKLGTKACVDRC